ncbi:MAG: hypothetical protein P1P76_07305 [Anaerolineales bacterium]|nr:hypothetical protein [Anaerolineales bacterium]
MHGSRRSSAVPEQDAAERLSTLRELTAFEIGEARLVFDGGLDFTCVRVIEQVRWPDRFAAFGAWVHRGLAPTHNAVTLGNRLHFPVLLRTGPTQEEGPRLSDMAWLIHELTHAWQYQTQGVVYLWKAVMAQIKLGHRAYEYGWEEGLNNARLRGDSLLEFNPEQQGDIARHYYYRRKQGLDTRAWDPFVLFFKS